MYQVGLGHIARQPPTRHQWDSYLKLSEDSGCEVDCAHNRGTMGQAIAERRLTPPKTFVVLDGVGGAVGASGSMCMMPTMHTTLLRTLLPAAASARCPSPGALAAMACAQCRRDARAGPHNWKVAAGTGDGGRQGI